MTEPFTPAPHHDVLLLLVQIAVLLFTARAFGEIALRFGQPSVVGEILAGVVLGPSLLSGVFPGLGAWIVPQTPESGYLLEVVSMLGAMFLLLITGLETDLGLIRRHARTALGASLMGVVFTFSGGFLMGLTLPGFLLADPSQRTVFALFVAVSLVISSVPVIAKVLMELKLMRRDISQTLLAAGMSDDTIGWVLLSIVAGVASAGAMNPAVVGQALASVAVFLLLSFTIGRWIVKRSLDFVQDEVKSAHRLLTLVVVLTFGWGAVTQALELEALLGAFVIGVLFAQLPRLPAEVTDHLEKITIGIFAPLFFAVVGLKMNLQSLFSSWELIGIALAFLAVATVTKVTGTYLGARLIGRQGHWNALSFGAGINARGAMGIIVASVGLDLGLLTQEMFTIILLMAIVTSLMAPPALRWVLAHVVPEKQELKRLKQEELAEESVVAKIHRVLLPARRRDQSKGVHGVESHILRKMSTGSDFSVTLLNVSSGAEKERGSAFLDRLGERFSEVELTKKVVASGDPAKAILAEAEKDYDLMILGATEKTRSGALFHPIVDEMVRMAPCPTLVVKGGEVGDEWHPGRILVPTNGSPPSRHAAEIAFLLAKDSDQEVLILHVLADRPGAERLGQLERMARRQRESARQFVEELTELGELQEVRVRGEVRPAADPEHGILDAVEAGGIELIVMGTDLRPGSERLYLGPRVEVILAGASCPVVVVNV
ncbi:MAG: cation:proton antiporter [Longimicrobiaceae bacterium]